MRWKYKHETPEKRIEDLKKAQHFLAKYIEVAHVYDSSALKEPTTYPTKIVSDFEGINNMLHVEGRTFRCAHCASVVLASSPMEAFLRHGNCPTPQGYVNQDR